MKLGLEKRSASKPVFGFTLIEILIVVGIVALLVGFALPSFQDAITKSRRAEAKELLLAVAQRQQQFYTENNTYTTAAADLTVPTSSSNGYYTLTIAAGSTGSIATSYLLSAAPAGTQTRDTACATFRLSSQGQKTVTGSQATPPCW